MTSQNLEIPLSGGLDEKTARKLVAPGSFLDLVNARFDLNGQISQRYGTVRYDTDDGSAVNIQPPRAGHAFQGAPVLVTDDKIYSFSQKQSKFLDRGRVSTPQITTKPLLQLASSYAAVDHAWYQNLHLVAVEQSVGANHQIWVTVYDDLNGTVLRGPEVVSVSANNSQSPRIFVCGSLAVLVYWDSTGNISAHTMSLAALPLSGWSGATVLKNTALVTKPVYDCRPVVGHAKNFYLVHASAGAVKVISSVWDSTSLGAAVASANLTAANVVDGIGVYARSGDSQYWVAWADSTGGVNDLIKYTAVTPATAAEQFAAQTVQSNTVATDGRFVRFAFCPKSTTTAVLYACQGGEFGTKPSVLVAGLNPPAFPADILSVARTYWLGVLTQPWVAPSTETSNRQYIGVQLFSTAQGSDYVAELDVSNLSALGQLQIAARFATRLTGSTNNTSAELISLCVPSVPNPQAGRYYIAHNVIVSGSGTGQRTQLAKTIVEWEPPTRHRGAAYRETLHLGGGCPQVFDGQRAYEDGFHWYPEIINVALTGAAGGLSAGNYLACACYVFTFATGETLRSAPSPPFPFTAALNDKATYSVRTYTAGAMRAYAGTQAVTAVRIECYRTPVGGQAFNCIDNATLTSANANDPTTNQVGVPDTQSDAGIATNLPLYTDGTPAPLENLCPPSLYPIAVHMGRMWGIDGRRIWYSDLVVPGEAPRWHEVQTIDIDEGEDLVGFIPIDGAMCVGSASKVFRLDGQPSDRLGNNSLTYSQISSSAGMGSIFSAKFDAGTMFQSPSGEIKMINRGFQIEDIGFDVLPSTLANPFMASGVSHGDQRELRFVVGVSPTSSSPTEVLVFETERKQWLKRRYNQTGVATQLKIKDAWLVGSTWHFVAQGTGGETIVWYENTASWLDSEEDFVEMTLGFPGVSMGSIQGYQRCRLVRIAGDHFTPHDVEMTIYHDGSETPAATRTFSDATYGALDPYELEHSPTRQKGSRFRVQVKTKAPTGGGALGNGRAVSWQSIAFMIDTLSGGRRTRPAVRG